jgi:hypothetical protein
MNIRTYTGSQTTVDSTLNSVFPGWTSQYVGNKIAYAIVKMDPSISAAFNTTYSGGIPDFSFDVLGAKCYDPRDGSHNIAVPSTWSFTTNASLIEANYLIHDCGAKVSTSRIDWTSVSSCATVDDVSINLLNGLTEKRYTASLYWETNERHEDVLERIGQAHAGGIRLIGNKWVMRTGEIGSSVATIVPGDYAGEGLSFSEVNSFADIANGVRGKFSSPLHNFEMRDYPAYQDSTHLSEDGGSERWLEVSFPCVTSASQAQRLARIAYNKNRLGHTANVTVKFKHFDVIARDLVTITDASAGFSAKTFRVTEDRVNDDMSIDLQLEYDTASFYSWSSSDEKAFDSYTGLTGEVGDVRNFGWTIIDTVRPGGNITPAAVIHAGPVTPSGADHYRWRSTAGTSFWTGAMTSTQTGNATAQGSATNVTYELRIEDVSNNVLQTVGTVATSGSSIADDDEAGATYFFLAAPSRPRIKNQNNGAAQLLVPTVPGVKADQVKLYEGTTNVFASATLVTTKTNSNAVFDVTGAAGTSKFYWACAYNSATSRLSQESNSVLVVFS